MAEPSSERVVCDVVAPGSGVLTDGRRAYNPLPDHGYTREKTVISSSGEQAHVSMPAVHRVASLRSAGCRAPIKGRVGVERLDAYLAEFTFRFNRRN